MAGATVAIELDEHVVEVSKPSKTLFPSGVTKLDLARYMEAVAPALLRHVADRPLNLQRFPTASPSTGSSSSRSLTTSPLDRPLRDAEGGRHGHA